MTALGVNTIGFLSICMCQFGANADCICTQLQATRLRRILEQSLRKSSTAINYRENLPADFVYSNPTVSMMVQALQSTAQPEGYEVLETMRSLSSKYCYQDEGANPLLKSNTVLLTGTTGNLGCYLLRMLSEHPCVRKLICLIRATSNVQPEDFEDYALVRQRKEFKDRGIVLTKNAWLKIRYQQWYVHPEPLCTRLSPLSML